MKSSANEDRGRRTDGPCPKCGSSDARAYYDNGQEHCFACGDHKNGDKAGRKRFEKRGVPKESRQALKDFHGLPPANAGHSYFKSHRHRGEFALSFVSDIRQDGKALVAPMYDKKRRLRNLQYIYPDGTKRTLAGVSSRGLFLRIGDGKSERAWVAEGWATAETMHDATGDDVYVAFGSANLAVVAEYVKSLGKHVAICGEVGENAALIAEQAAAAVCGDLFIPKFPDGVRGTDANDLGQKLGIKELRKQIEKNTAPIPPPPDPIEIAAGMSRKDYREFRSALAKSMGISVQQLDREVQRKAQELIFEETIPWPEPVDGNELLDGIKKILDRHVSLPDYANTAVTLWVVMTYLVDEVYTAAMLALLSPEMQCGKTTLLTCLSRLVFRPLQASNITPAAIYRMVEQHQPTLLVDEFDSFQNSNDELRGILNSGHSRDMAFVIRCVGDDNNPIRFSTFCAKAYAMIGTPAPTLADRSIILLMRRKLVGDKRKKFKRPKPGDAFDKLRRQIFRWTQDNGVNLDKVRIRRPEGLSDRAYDNWLPLFQIAKRIGGDWQDKAVDAALSLAAQETSQDESTGVLLLKDLQGLFEREQEKLLGTTFILNELAQMDDRPWPEYRRGEPITSQQMAEILKPFGIRPKLARRAKGKPVRGYRLRDCGDAFARYVR